MANLKEMIKCSCGNNFEVEKHENVNAASNPELMKRLLDGTLLKTKCPKCGKEIELTYPVSFNPNKPCTGTIQFYPYDNIEEVEERVNYAMSKYEEGMLPPELQLRVSGFSHPKVTYVKDYKEFLGKIKECTR